MSWIEQIRSRLRGAAHAPDTSAAHAADKRGARAPDTGGAGAPGLHRSPASRAEVEAALRSFMAERSDGNFTPDAFDPHEHLFDTGYIDSMSSLTLLVFLEDRYGVEVPEVDLVGNLSTLAALADHVAEQASAAP